MELQDMIKKARGKVCNDGLQELINMKYISVEEALKDYRAPEWAYIYTLKVLKKRWPEAERVIMTSAGDAYFYASNIIKGRWTEAESVIMTSYSFAYLYAKYIIKARWPEAEEYIKKDPTTFEEYNNFINVD